MPYAQGSLSTSATTEVAVNATTYTEPTSTALRGIKSSSANDAAAGTGARTVRITFYSLDANNVLTGPFTETITLNGTTIVPTVSALMTFIEKMEVMTAGSGGVAAGTIILTAASDGSGGTIASIATGKLQTFFAQHYVASGARCYITSVQGTGGDAAAASLALKVAPYPLGLEKTLVGGFGASLATPLAMPLGSPGRTIVLGPARVRLMVTPANGNAQVTSAGFGFYDER